MTPAPTGHPAHRRPALAPLRRLLARGRRGVLFAAHGVTRGAIQTPLEQVQMRFDEFVAIVELLQALDFDFLSTDQLAALAQRGFAHNRHWTHLSFDDGYRNICDDALPWLRERGLPFTLFVSTHHIESGEPFPTFVARYAHSLGKNLAPVLGVDRVDSADAAEQLLKFSDSAAHESRLQQILNALDPAERAAMQALANEVPMDLEALRKAAALPGAHIGSHMHHHWLFHPAQSTEAMRLDLLNSLDRLTRRWGVCAAPCFCYPNGNYDRRALDLLREAGVALGFTSQSGFVDGSTDPLLLPRFTMTNRARAQFICALSAVGNRSLRLFGRRPPALAA